MAKLLSGRCRHRDARSLRGLPADRLLPRIRADWTSSLLLPYLAARASIGCRCRSSILLSSPSTATRSWSSRRGARGRIWGEAPAARFAAEVTPVRLALRIAAEGRRSSLPSTGSVGRSVKRKKKKKKGGGGGGLEEVRSGPVGRVDT